ncbi:MAG: DUF2905 domain-containing protein [Chloroflexota bacterium]|nr:DUF2905 domain-containing protein [Chloroflexota bacterium]
MSPDLGRVLIVVGTLIVILGVMSVLGIRLPFGRLPGDIAIEGRNGSLFIPITSMLVVSVVLSVIVTILFRR